MLCVLLCLILLCNAGAPLCGTGATRKVINFDDIPCPYSTVFAPVINGLRFRRLNTPYTSAPDDLAQILNVTYQAGTGYFPEYIGTAPSPTNTLYTTQEILSVRMNGGQIPKTFGLYSFKMMSVYLNNMNVFVNITNTNAAGKVQILNSTIINLNVGIISTVVMDVGNIEGFSVSCVNDTYCSVITYDDMDICTVY